MARIEDKIIDKHYVGLVPGGGRTHQRFTRGGSAPRSKPLPFYVPFLIEKVPPFVYLP